MLIHLIRSPLGYFLYDAKVNKVESISKSLYAYLSQLEDYSNLPDSCPDTEEIISLQERGLLSPCTISGIKHPLTEHLPDFLYRSLSHLILQVTQNCNFRCSYCPYTDNTGIQRLHSTQRMTIDSARRALDFLHKHSIDAPTITVGFYGGEPLLEFALIKQVVYEAEKMFEGKELSFNMTSNGSLLTNEVLDFLTDQNFTLSISLDGPKEVNDKNRKFHNNNQSAFSCVQEKVNLIKNNYPEFLSRLTFTVVMDPANDYSAISALPDILDARTVPFLASIVNDLDAKEKHSYEECFISPYQYAYFLRYLSKIKRYIPAPIEIIANIFEQETFKVNASFQPSPLPDITTPGGPCAPGYKKFFVNVEGNIYACEKVPESESMKIGDIYSGFNMEKVNTLLNIGRLTKDKCIRCWAFRLCGSCMLYACNGEELSSQKRSDFCREIKAQAHQLIRSYILRKDLNHHNIVMEEAVNG